eukprot:6885473-Prymnesium_polylepis.1
MACAALCIAPRVHDAFAETLECHSAVVSCRRCSAERWQSAHRSASCPGAVGLCVPPAGRRPQLPRRQVVTKRNARLGF